MILKIKKNDLNFFFKIKFVILPVVVSIPFDRVAFNNAERRFDVADRFGRDAKVGFVVGTEGDGLICVFTIVDVGLFVVADVTFPFACARI